MERAAADGDADEAVKHYDELKCVFDKLVEFLSQPDCIEVAKKMDQLIPEGVKD